MLIKGIYPTVKIFAYNSYFEKDFQQYKNLKLICLIMFVQTSYLFSKGSGSYIHNVNGIVKYRCFPFSSVCLTIFSKISILKIYYLSNKITFAKDTEVTFENIYCLRF